MAGTAPPQTPTTGSTAKQYDRLPPHSVDAEMATIGSMCLNREAIEMVLPIIGREDSDRFYRADHRLVFEVLIDLYDRGEPVDLVVVHNELQRRDQLEEIGGDEYLVRLAESVPSWVNAEYYARIVRDKGMLRDLIRAAGQIAEEAYSDDDDDVRMVLDRAEQKLFSVTEQRISGQAEPLGDFIEETWRQIESRDGHYLTGEPSGFVELDDMLSGFQPGELIIVAARPSMGKTAWGLNAAEHLAVDEGRPVGFFSMEMSKQQLAQRVLCSRGRIDSHKLRRGMLSAQELTELASICDGLMNAPLLIDDTPGMTVLELRSKARRLKAKSDICAVFVDYLQLMHTPGAESRQVEISVISRGLKALGRELRVPIVALAQLNRQPEGREGHKPRMSDLRESGALEQDADVVLLLHREEYYKPTDESVRGQAEVIVSKQRNGPTGTVKLHFNKKLTRFDNLAVGPAGYSVNDVPAAPEPYDMPAPPPGPGPGSDLPF
jgi:replicative DNA helicase